MSDEPMPAGPSLDEAVATRLLGFRVEAGYHAVYSYDIPTTGEKVLCTSLPQFSRDMGLAWLVFTAALQCVGHAEIAMDMEDYGRRPGDIATVTIGDYTLTGEAPWAICNAALWATEATDA